MITNVELTEVLQYINYRIKILHLIKYTDTGMLTHIFKTST